MSRGVVNTAVTGVGSQIFPALYPDTANAQEISVTTSSQQSTSLVGATALTVSTHAAGCYIAIGSNPIAIAAAGGLWIPPNTIRDFSCNEGDKVAAITATSTATLSVCPAKMI